MAFQRPTKLKELSEFLGISVEEVLITCFYCNRWLTGPEKVLFVHSDLGIYYKDDVYYAACQACIKTACKLDFLVNYQGFISTTEAEILFASRFEDLDVRCWGCLRKLTRTEKVDVVRRRDDVAVIKDQPRSRCTLCLLGLS